MDILFLIGDFTIFVALNNTYTIFIAVTLAFIYVTMRISSLPYEVSTYFMLNSSAQNSDTV